MPRGKPERPYGEWCIHPLEHPLALNRPLTMCQLDILRLLAEEGPRNIYQISGQLGYRYAHVHKSVKVLKALGLVREQEAYYKRRKMLNVALTHFGYIIYLAAWKEETGVKISIERAIYTQRNLFPDLFYVYWLISDKVFEEEELPDVFYVYEVRRNEKLRWALAEWEHKGRQGPPPSFSLNETRQMGKKPGYKPEELFKAMVAAAKRDMVRLRVKLRASSDKLPLLMRLGMPGDVAQELAERGEVEFDTFLPAEVLSPTYEQHEMFLTDVDEDGFVYCPAAPYYYGIGLGELFNSAESLYDIFPKLLRKRDLENNSLEVFRIANILLRPDKIFAGMVFKELELRGLPEKHALEIKSKDIKLIIEPVKSSEDNTR